jgi:hypothetical protein
MRRRLILGACGFLILNGIIEIEYSILICSQGSGNQQVSQNDKHGANATCNGPFFSAVASGYDWLASRSSESITAVATAVIALFTLTLWWTTRGLLRVGVINTRHTEKSIELLVADQRPWVSADISLASGLTMDVNGLNVTLSFALKNTGRSPALNVRVVPEIYPMIAPNPDPVGRQKAIADQEAGREATERWGITIFPGDRIHLNISITLSHEEIRRYDAWFTDANATNSSLFLPSLLILGSIAYRSVITSEHLQTGFIRQLEAFDKARSIALGIPKFTSEFPHDRVRLQYYIFGDAHTR